jgi:hypothetical protein
MAHSSTRLLWALGKTPSNYSSLMPADDWSHGETDDPLYADDRNFYKVEK